MSSGAIVHFLTGKKQEIRNEADAAITPLWHDGEFGEAMCSLNADLRVIATVSAKAFGLLGFDLKRFNRCIG